MSLKSAFWWMADEKLSQNLVHAIGSPLKVGSDNLGNFALHGFALPLPLPPLTLPLLLFEIILTFSTIESTVAFTFSLASMRNTIQFPGETSEKYIDHKFLFQVNLPQEIPQ